MIETEYRLEHSRTATLASNGQATITGIGPAKPGERWKVTRISVNTTSGCRFQVFRGNSTDASNQIDFTAQGSGDTSETNLELRAGETISVKWSNGTNGAVGTVRFEGAAFIPGRRAY